MIPFKYRLIFIGIIAGAVGGFLYFQFIGCEKNCMITSNPFSSTMYGGLMGGLLFSLFQKNNSRYNMKANSLLKENLATVIDVRTAHEFKNGHAPGSLNIPLQELPARVNEIKSLNKPVILCCASGNRSGQATSFLSAQGIECYNAGSWLDIQNFKA